MYRINDTQKQNKLIKCNKNVFKTSELAILWQIFNKNTLWTTIKRYVKAGILYTIQKGIYTKVSLDKVKPYEVACSICGNYSYVSNETVLFVNGLINQKLSRITLLGLKSKEFTINGEQFLCRKFPINTLINREDILDDGTYAIANVKRAICDQKALFPKYYIDNTKLLKKLMK